jgi:plasmid stability protein
MISGRYQKIFGMGQVIIRNLDEGVVAALKARAERMRKPLEQTLRDIVTEAARKDKEAALDRIRKIRAMSPFTRIDATGLVREDRDR